MKFVTKTSNFVRRHIFIVLIVVISLVLVWFYFDSRSQAQEDTRRLDALIELSQSKDRLMVESRLNTQKELTKFKDQNNQLITEVQGLRENQDILISQLERLGVQPKVSRTSPTTTAPPKSRTTTTTAPPRTTTTIEQAAPTTTTTQPPTTTTAPPPPPSCSIKVAFLCVQ